MPTGLSDDLIAAFLAAANRAADAAGAAIHGRAQVGDVETKSDGSPSLIADRLAEEAALTHLLPLGVKIISEEGFGGGEHPAPGEPWLALDPIDGTGNFRAGLAPYAFSVGMLVDGLAVAGLVHEHATRRRWQGAAGHGAWRDGRPIAPRPGGTVMVPTPDVGSPAVVPVGFQRLRISGCAAFDLCCVTDGAAGAWHNLDRGGTHTHDVAGALGVAAGAGCAVVGADDGPVVLPTDTHALTRFVLAADQDLAHRLIRHFATAEGRQEPGPDTSRWTSNEGGTT